MGIGKAIGILIIKEMFIIMYTKYNCLHFRAQFHFKILPNNYEFPVAKPKRPSFEYYNTKGILKKNWMLKHLHVLPAVVVLFLDLEWNDPQWSEKQMQCALAVQSLKNALEVNVMSNT